MRKLLVFPLVCTVLAGQPIDESVFKGDPLKAAFLFAERARALKPDSFDILLFLGDIRHAQGDPSAAESWYTKARLLRPKDSSTYLLIGTSYLHRSQDAKKAEEMFSLAEITEPGRVSTCRDIGMAWLAVGNKEKALQQAIKAKERVNQDPGDAAEFATALLTAGHQVEAFELMDLAFKANPRMRDAFKTFGSACLKAGLPKDGVRWMDHARAVKPRDLNFYREVAVAYADNVRKEDREAIKSSLQTAVDLGFQDKKPDNDELIERAAIHLAMDELDKAEDTFRKVTLSKEVAPGDLSAIGRAYSKHGFHPEAARAYALVTGTRESGKSITFGSGVGFNTSPGFGVGLFGGYTLDISKNQKKNALSESALDLIALGQVDTALPMMDEAFLLDSEDHEMLVSFGEACLKAGRDDHAFRYFAKAVKTGEKEQDEDLWLGLAKAFLSRASTAKPSTAPASSQGGTSEGVKTGSL